MKKAFFSLLSIGLITFFGFKASTAFFSDQETSYNNAFEAGSIDLKIRNQSYLWRNNQWEYNQDNSWALQDMLPQFRYFDFTDVKPGDLSQDTVELQVDTNQAWVCADITLTESAENTVLEPETAAGDDSADGSWDGELDQELQFIFWADDGDYTLEVDESILHQGNLTSLPQGNGNSGITLPVIDSQTNPWGIVGQPMNPGPEGKIWIGKAWCHGTLTTNAQSEADGISEQRPLSILCNGEELTNISQTDSVKGDIGFYAVQERNNSSFLCTHSYLPLESLNISSLSPDVVESITVLESGKTYVIEVSGTYTFAPGGRIADAEFWYNPDTLSWYEEIEVPPVEYNLDLMVNNVPRDWLGSADGVNYYPHTFSPDHKYILYIQGENHPISFYIYDSSHDWNEGSLTVSIKSL